LKFLYDDEYEDNETFSLEISNSQDGYEVTKSSGTAIIYNDDELPLEAKIHNRYEDEGDSNWSLNVYIRLNQPAPEDITIDYSTQDDTAIAGRDYVANSGTVMIVKGKDEVAIPMTIIGNMEVDEISKRVFYVNVNSISSGTITNNPSSVTLVDDDNPEVYISAIDTIEGNTTQDSGKIPFKIYLNKEYLLDTPLTINYETVTSTTSPSATASEDYEPASGSVTFEKGDSEKIIYISIIGDTTIEEDEYVRVDISGDYIETSSAEARIINDDGEFPTLSFEEDISVVEGNSSSEANYLEFKLSLNSPAIEGSSFDYYTMDGDEMGAEAGEDYEEISKTTYTFQGGETSVSIPVKVIGDTEIESDEIIYLVLENPKNVKFDKTKGEGYIKNDDGEFPKVSIVPDNMYVSEGEDGDKKSLEFNITLDRPSTEDGAYIKFKTYDATAYADTNDYEPISETQVIFNKGEQVKSFSVVINGDDKVEDDEYFYIKLFSAYHLDELEG